MVYRRERRLDRLDSPPSYESQQAQLWYTTMRGRQLPLSKMAPISKLPQKVFDRITHALVGSSSTARALEYSQVCHAFAHSILKSLVRRAYHLSFAQIFANARRKKLFELYGSNILGRKALCSAKTESPFIKLIQSIVIWLLKKRCNSRVDIKSLRSRYTADICDAVMALDEETLQKVLLNTTSSQPGKSSKPVPDFAPAMLPAVAAAIGDTDLLTEHTSKATDLYEAPCEYFPAAIATSVACGQTKMLQFILEYLEKKVKGKPEALSWRPMRSAARAIGQSLRVAIKLHKTEAANIIFGFLANNETFMGSSSWWLGEQLCKDCMRYANADLMYEAFAYDRTARYDPCNSDPGEKFSISPYEFEFLLNHGHWTALDIIIKKGLLGSDPTLVKYALDKRKGDVARILLENGVDVNAPVDSISEDLKGKTVSWHVAKGGYYADVRLLLLHGAEPDHP
ncbi:hypothetical protein BKA63DRAFT_485193 [Paraphoma chrysanthemicola]|nr:hypothetical protein BKA63DRAFT_485193 [Paraphoma chrysanthemicola]